MFSGIDLRLSLLVAVARRAQRERLAEMTRNAKLAERAAAAARRERLRNEKFEQASAQKALAQKEKEQKAALAKAERARSLPTAAFSCPVVERLVSAVVEAVNAA